MGDQSDSGWMLSLGSVFFKEGSYEGLAQPDNNKRYIVMICQRWAPTEAQDLSVNISGF